jgi:hypothetical protein
MSISSVSGPTLNVAPLTKQPAPVARNKAAHAEGQAPKQAAPTSGETLGRLNITA